jgi:hypothetical protein
MKQKEIFCIAVRLLGLVFLYHGLMAVPVAAGMFFSGFQRFGEARNIALGPLMIAWPLAVTWWLIRGAPLLICIAYREEPPVAKPAA